jgi:glycerate kinase
LLKDGISNFTVGIGGSATNDGGAGMAQALGYEFYDHSGNIITEKMNGRLMGQISKIVSPILPYFRIKAAGDVKNPLLGKHGAVYTYALQKGATLADLPVLEKNMANLSARFHKDLCRKIDNIEGVGAAGGLGAGLMAFCDAEIVSGSQHILRILNFHDKIKNADLVITGEGKYDDQTNQGKIVSEIVRASKKNKVPVYGIFGKIDTSAKGQLEKCIQLIDFAEETETMKNPKKYLEMAVKNIFTENPE